ncbi:S8 family serine peptidase [Herbiconiux sp. CPCC 205763]|uniref:S8 family serine peptidase n=1 Tax=Herbiconiux aconitum TaxID=2970913 RepID=A0ABT2GQS0_9MICO|nr:S8 family peptidase [Herbiconiux aconitum]MCS5717289.1 S8 family serine peptidase [Herbiconiux aconitum]
MTGSLARTRRPRRSRRLTGALAALSSAALVGLGCLLPTGAAGAATPVAATALGAPTIGAVTAATPATPPAGGYEAGRYIVTLKDPAVASYAGGIAGLRATRAKGGSDLDATSRAAQSYSAHLTDTQDVLAAEVGASVTTSYTLATNGFSSELSAEQAQKLADDPRVAAVVPDEILRLDEPESSTQFLGLDGDDGVWAAIGGVENAGKGVVVGVIDTGVAPENPSFAGDPLGTTPGDAPYRDGDTIVFDKADGSEFHGTCVAGVQFTTDDCSTKIVGAQFFVDNFGVGNIGDPAIGEYLSPRDGVGHGSHTASTAAGQHDVPATVAGTELGEISGVAPAAKIAAYKVCWEGPDPVSPLDDGCATGDILHAIDAAVADGVDVINYSIGAGAAETTVSLTDQAFFNAAAAGIFVAASAGNDGDAASTADNASPWITTVAASTIPTRDATARLGDGQAFVGASITLPADGTISGRLVAATAAAAAGATDPQLCGPDTLDPAAVAGAIVLCERGVIDRTLKSAEVARAGGIGMLLVNPTQSSLDLDAHTVPTVHVNADAYEAVTAYAATPGATVTFENGNTTGTPSAPSPQVAGFSSRGPILADGGDMLKPDITAPGVAILAAGANPEGEAGTWEFMSGTSMASPHIAGLAALYLGVHPDAAPAEIKSAMMTTAYDTLDASGAPAEDPFAQGAGHVDPTRFFEPGLLYLNDVDDWMAYTDALGYTGFGSDPLDPSDLNLASIGIGGLPGTQTVTRTVTATAAGSYTAAPVSMPGIDVAVSPTTLSFGAAGEEQSYTVTFTRTDAPLDAFSTGYLDWADDATGASVRSPLAVRPISLDAPAEAVGDGATGSVDVPVLGGDTATYEIASSGLARGQVARGNGAAGSSTQAFVFDVPEGSTFARFDLDAADDSADLDLSVYSVDSLNHSYLVGQSATGSADERVDLDADMLQPGHYIVAVDFFAGTGDLGYTLTTSVLDPAAATGSFAVTPTSLSTVTGETSTVTASWSGLAPGGSYLGRISYGNTGHNTVVTVTTPGSPEVPPASDEPVASVDPFWLRAGDGTSVRAAGLTPGSPYTVKLDSGSEPVTTGVVDDSGSLWRYLVLPADIALGDHTLTIATADDAVTADFVVTDVVAQHLDPWVNHDFDGNPTVSLDVTFVGKGDLRVRLESDSGKVYTDTTERAEAPSDAPNYTFRTGPFAVQPGSLTATLWVVDASGAMTQEISTTFTADILPPSSITITPNAANPSTVDVVVSNAATMPIEPRVQYKLCTGPMVFAEEFYDVGDTAENWDLTGVAHVDVVSDDGSGTVLAAFDNAGPNRCAENPSIAQDFWMTMDARPATGDTANPITLTVSNRVDVHSPGFDLSAGVGSTVFETEPLLYEMIPTPELDTPGPVEERTLAVAENTPYWATARYGQHMPWGNLQKKRDALVPALTLAQLAAVVAPGDPGQPGDPGTPADPTTPATPAPAASSGSGTSSGALAATGLTVGLPVAIAVALLLLGAAFVLVRRAQARSRRVAAATSTDARSDAHDEE